MVIATPLYRSSVRFMALMIVSSLCRRVAAFGPIQTQQFIRNGSICGKVVSSLDIPTSRSSSSSSDQLLDPLIVCGPSGVGKGTIIEKYMREWNGRSVFEFSVSHTTRSPREGESNGQHYHFVTHERMNELLDEDHFLEHAEVHGNHYGTSWDALSQVQTSGKRCLLDIDTKGVQNIQLLQQTSPHLRPKYIFIAPPSIETLEERLIGRASESEESLRRRIGNAKAEVDFGLAQGNFDAVVVNDDLEQAVRRFDQAVRDLYSLDDE